MTAPGLDAPGYNHFEVAGRAPIKHGALRDHGAGIDAELAPLLRDHAASASHDGTRFAFHGDMDGERLTARHVPLAAALGEPSLLKQFRRRLGVRLPPAAPECDCDLLGPARNLIAHRWP